MFLQSGRYCEEDGGGEGDVGGGVEEVGVHHVVEHRVQLESPREPAREADTLTTCLGKFPTSFY